jgi:hypothetical protein
MEKKELLATEVFAKLGIEGVENLDQFTEKFNKSFVSRQVALEDDELKSKITGRITGGLSTLFKREFELENKDIEGKKVEEILTFGVQKMRSKLAEYEANAGKQKSEIEAELLGKVEKYKKTTEDYKGQLDGLSKTLEEKQNLFEKEKKSWVINQSYGESYKKVFSQFAEDVTKDPLRVEGFNTVVSKTFQFDLDETGNLSVFDTQGNRVANPNKIGAFLTPEEALLKIATENKLLKLNDAKQTAVKQTVTQTTQQTSNGATRQHPNLARFGIK